MTGLETEKQKKLEIGVNPRNQPNIIPTPNKFPNCKNIDKNPYARDTPLPPLLSNFPAVPLGQWKSVPEDTSHANNFLQFQSYLENQ